MHEIHDYIFEHQKEILKDIKYIVKADSPSREKELMDSCAQRIQQLFIRYFGYPAEVVKETLYGNHLRFEYGEGDRQILLLTHFDTVWDAGELTVKEDGNRIYGPGILDMKSGLVQAIWAIKSFHDLGINLNKRIVMLCTSDEEIGSPSSKKLIEQEALNSDAAFVMEPPVTSSGALKTGRKGTSKYTIEVNGRASHAGNHHKKGISAIREIAKQILYVESLTDYDKGTTVNVGAIKGGGKLNVVPDKATIGIDIRAKTVEEQKRIHQLIMGLKPQTEGIVLNVKGGINRPPMERGKATFKLFKLAQEAAAGLGVHLVEAAVGGASDGNLTAHLGIPTLDGLGAMGSGIHERSEHIVVDEIPNRTAILSMLLLKTSSVQ
ncbi:M20 family metallopeptidase [Chungangia koreensis]|uniref:M20 family metallopeptidase n=1 Tax=Chungangia koreensis TaxID=752657 RepID=A0ABV8XAQ8_9LACT